MTGVPVSVTRRQASLTDSDLATEQTIEVMVVQDKRSILDPVLRAAARDAVERFRGGPLYAALGIDPRTNPAAIAESIWWAAKHALRFEHHEDTIRVWFNERDQLQLLISPDLLMRLGPTKGDCAIYTTLICAMLGAWGIPYEYVTVAADPFAPDIFGHVYCRAVMPDGARIALDASHGAYPGWEVPREHIIRKAIWNSDGDQIPDQGPRFRGLHAYIERRPGFVRSAYPGFGRLGRRRGLGQFLAGYDEAGNPVYSPELPAAPPSTTPSMIAAPLSSSDIAALSAQNAAYFGAPSGGPASTPSAGPGAGSSPWAAFVQSLSTQGLNIVGRIVAPTTTIQSGPGGTFIQAPARAAIPTGAVLPSAVGGGSSLLLIGGALLLIVLVAGAGKH